MDKSYFIEYKNHLTYKVVTNTHKKDYDIPKSELGNCKYNSNRISDWVEHISNKGWASRRMMLCLCDKIKRLCPDNNINWEETYLYIDSTDYETI
ncbi:MAG: hypothetical protein WCJ33_09305 [Pseudomonadota bacterium]